MFKISVDGLVVFVTGANRKNGIGRALVEEAIKRGAKKVYATARNISQLDGLVSGFQGKVVPIELDVTNLEHIQISQTALRDCSGDTSVCSLCSSLRCSVHRRSGAS